MENGKRESRGKLNSFKPFFKKGVDRHNTKRFNKPNVERKHNRRPFFNKYKGKNNNSFRPIPKAKVSDKINSRAPDLYLWIKETCNNIFLTVTAPNGNVRFSISGGFSGLRGNNKTSYRSIEVITKILLGKLRKIKVKKIPVKSLCIFLATSKNKTVKSILEILKSFNRIYLLVARVRVPHNGLRPRSIRRLL